MKILTPQSFASYFNRRKLTSRYFFFYILLLLLIPGFTTQAQDVPLAEREALIDLYQAAGGEYWQTNTNWATTEPVTNWFGVTVTNLRVVAVELPGNRLVGVVPASINDLDTLQILNLGANDIYDFPEITGFTPQLLDIRNNRLTFEDILPSVGIADSFQYSPQMNLDTLTRYAKKGASTYALFYLEYIDNSNYEWSLRDTVLASSTNPIHLINNVSSSDVGVYRIEITHPEINDLIMIGWVDLDLLCEDIEGGYYVCNEFIVQFEDGADINMFKMTMESQGVKQKKKCMCGEKIQLYKVVNVYSETVIDGKRDVAESLAGTDSTGFNFVTNAMPDNSQLPNGMPAFFDPPNFDTTRAAVKVALIDTGFDFGHPDLQDIIWRNPDVGENCIEDDLYGYDFKYNRGYPYPKDEDGHGTHIAGIITNTSRVNVDIMNLKYAEAGVGTLFDGVCAIYYSLKKKADVINLSWGFLSKKVPWLLNDALEAVAEKGEVVVIASAGNEINNNDDWPHWPSNFSTQFTNFISVGAYYIDLTNEYHITPFSNFGNLSVDLLARGGHIQSAFPIALDDDGDGLRLLSGTSMAAANVTGVAVELLSCNPTATATQVVDCIKGTVQVLPFLDDLKIVATEGILDPVAAKICITGTHEIHTESLLIYPQPFIDIVHFDVSQFKGEKIELSIYNLTGSKIYQQAYRGEEVIAWDSNSAAGAMQIPGFYFYQIKVGNQLYSGKLIKQ